MGGASGGFNFSHSSKLYNDIKSQLDQNSNTDNFQVDLATFFGELLSNYNNRDVDTINRHLEEIKSSLDKELEDTLSLNFGGSISKHTYVDGLSDADVLVLINNSDLQNKSSKEVLSYFYKKLTSRFPSTKIEKGSIAITIKFSDIDIQLLPAIKMNTGYKIANSSNDEWSTIKPQKFASELTTVNQRLGNKLIPTIKLIKSIISQLPPKKQISSYHVETMAVKIFKDYKGETKHSEMIETFFNKSSEIIKHKITDQTGQSGYVDTYLGKSNSILRIAISDSLNRIYRKIERAKRYNNIEDWKMLFNEI